MKTKLTLLFTAVFILFSICASAQVINPKKEAEKESTNRVNKKIDKGIDKGLDKLEEGLGGLFGKKKKKKNKKNQEQNPAVAGTEVGSSSTENLTAWTKFDFVPGDLVIFEDNLEGEVNGEFPSKWDLDYGNVEIARLGDAMVINFPSDQNSTIVPLMKEKGDYLPDKFTLEFDAYFSEFCTTYKVEFYDKVNQKQPSGASFVSIRATDVYVEGYGGTDVSASNPTYPYWKHISISFNIRALKVYYGETRTNNIPNFKQNPTGITIQSGQCHKGNQAMIKNIRIAEGSKDLYERFMTDGKIIANGIRFDVNKATLRPESMGVINQIYKLMAAHPEISFSVEGHTDSDGDEAMNQNLSEQRANTVMAKLVEMGIQKNRLIAKGFGETMPIMDNATPEGKANNRRVEFVKIGE